jgi:hypothetical protein
MNQLVLMYVYYDKHGNIKAITPSEDSQCSKEFSFVMIPLKDVEDFITGKKNTFEYYIKTIKQPGGQTQQLAKKVATVSVARSLDSYLTKISTDTDFVPAVRVISNVRNNSVTLALSSVFRDMYDNGTDDEIDQITEFMNLPNSSIYITKKNDPYSLIAVVDFVPADLFDKPEVKVAMLPKVDLRNSSAYTKRLVDSYSYVIRE